MVRTLPAGMPTFVSRASRSSAGMSANARSTRAITSSRCSTRSPLVAMPGVSGSSPNSAHSRRHSDSLAQATWTLPSAQWNRPYGAIEGWWLPCARPTWPATVHAVPWKACTPTIAASSEVRTTWPRPVRSRSSSAASTPYAPYMPASRSPIGTPTRCGSSGPGPVTDISPPSPCAIWSYPARPPSGPSWPKPLIARVTSRALSSASTSVPNPSRARVPGRKFSSRTSARRSRAVSSALSSSALRSRVIDCLLRLAARKYVDSRSPAAGCTKGGPQPRVSSPLPGLSTLITRAPRSPSIIAACGPARARVRSTTRTPSRGPLMPRLPFLRVGGRPTLSVGGAVRRVEVLPATRRRDHGRHAQVVRLVGELADQFVVEDDGDEGRARPHVPQCAVVVPAAAAEPDSGAGHGQRRDDDHVCRADRGRPQPRAQRLEQPEPPRAQPSGVHRPHQLASLGRDHRQQHPLAQLGVGGGQPAVPGLGLVRDEGGERPGAGQPAQQCG